MFYKKKDYKEIVEKRKDLEKKLDDQRERAQDVILKASRCMSSQLFEDYKNAFVIYEKNLLDILKGYPVNDPEYALVCCKYLTELSILGKLLKDVSRNAKSEDWRANI